MMQFLAMGGYAEYVWSVYALGVVTIVYNLVSARRRLQLARDRAALHVVRRAGRARRSADVVEVTQ